MNEIVKYDGGDIDLTISIEVYFKNDSNGDVDFQIWQTYYTEGGGKLAKPSTTTAFNNEGWETIKSFGDGVINAGNTATLIIKSSDVHADFKANAVAPNMAKTWEITIRLIDDNVTNFSDDYVLINQAIRKIN